MTQQRNLVLYLYGLLVVASIVLMFTRLRFSFDFEQFFPKGDPDWEFFKEFIEQFENDDNFLLIGVEQNPSVFDSAFLKRFHQMTLESASLPHVTSATSLTKIQYPLKTPFGVTALPALHWDQPEFYDSDRSNLLQDKRFVNSLISSDASALTIVMKTVNKSTQEQAEMLMDSVQVMLRRNGFEDAHVLGRANFQKELVWMQQREVAVSTVVAAILTALIMFFIFRRWKTVFISLMGIGLSLLFFIGLLAGLGRELTALSALYPVLMCIVGVADTIHITSKYLDELQKGHDQETAIRTTMREIGFATFITCLTTAIGFASLLTNRTGPIQDLWLALGHFTSIQSG
jgi:uncharacterized protein